MMIATAGGFGGRTYSTRVVTDGTGSETIYVTADDSPTDTCGPVLSDILSAFPVDTYCYIPEFNPPTKFDKTELGMKKRKEYFREMSRRHSKRFGK